MKDYVIVCGNEKEYFDRAESLGFKELMLLYPLTKFDSIDISALQQETKIKLSKGIIAEKGEIRAARKIAFTAVKSDVENREVLESGPNLMFGFEEASKRDFLHHRGSGFNQVLAKIAKDRSVIAGFSFSSLLRADPVLRSQIIGRMSQNKMLFDKYKVDYIVASFAENPDEMRFSGDLNAFLRIL